MTFSGTLDLTGLKVALAVEAAGNWKEYNDGPKVEVSDQQAHEICNQILNVAGPTDMPPDTRLLRLLVDAAAALHLEEARSYGWRVLGIEPKDGRRHLGTGWERVDWPVWFAAVNYGLGFASHAKPEAYFIGED